MTESRLRRVPRQARSREKLAKVLAAADRLIAEEGVEALTTTRVAAEAGVSVGALYQYLPDRDAITEALGEVYLARLEDLMNSFAEQAAGEAWPDPVGLLVDAFAGLYRAEPGFRALWFGRGLSDGTREADHAHKRVMATGVHRVLVAQKLLRDDYPAAVACRTAFLAADAVIQEVFRGDGAPELLEPVKTMLRAYLGQLPRP